MVSAFAEFGFTYLCLAFAALHLSTTFLDRAGTRTTTSSAEAPLLDSAAEVLPPLAAVVALFVAVAFTYRHLQSRRLAAAAVPAGNGPRRSTSALVMLALCVSVGTLEFVVFGQASAGGGCGGGGAGLAAQARALGLAALRALPAVATVMLFCGMMLIFAGVEHVRADAGGEAGGPGVVAGDGRQLLRLLTNVAAGAAAALVGLMVMALVLHGLEY